jgi:ATP-dependent DNA helicase RecQ
MGIDKSNVRYVMHAQAPKTIENYQQEAGRAGRDGLPSECILLWSKSDFALWRKILRELEAEARNVSEAKLTQLSRYCEESVCRHKALVQYFGQAHNKGNCGACDHCLGETKVKTAPLTRTLGQRVATTDPLMISQKILSCVVRMAGSYPIGYVGRVLVGSKDKRIAEYGHDTLSTYGILRSEERSVVRDWLGQLVDQEFLTLTSNGEISQVTDKGRQVLRGEITPALVRSEGESDPRLFEELRVLRRRIADERNVAAFVVFSDAVLHEMSARRPSTIAAFGRISGVGENKAMQYGRRFVECITTWCTAMDMPLDVTTSTSKKSPNSIPQVPLINFVERRAYELFRRGDSIDDVVVTLKRARSTVVEYLTGYIQRERIRDPRPWVDQETVARVQDAADRVGVERLKPVFDQLGGSVDYETIKIILGCWQNAAGSELSRAAAGHCVQEL